MQHSSQYTKLVKNTTGVKMWILKNAPTLVVIVPAKSANSGDHNGGIPVSVRVLGDENRNLPSFCLPTLTRNPLGVPGRIMHRWKDLFKEITTPLRSRETVQYSRRNYGDKLAIMDLRGGVAPSFLSRPPGSLNVDERLPRTLRLPGGLDRKLGATPPLRSI